MKLKITESQLNRIKRKLNEQEESNKYSRPVSPSFYVHKSTFKGMPIEEVLSSNFNVTYSIDIDARNWGIKDISLFNIKGPSEIQVEVSYYKHDSEELIEEMTTLYLDWSKLNVEENKNNGAITVDEDVEIVLGNDNEGNLIVNQINMISYTI
jgi:hypothetical protein